MEPSDFAAPVIQSRSRSLSATSPPNSQIGTDTTRLSNSF